MVEMVKYFVVFAPVGLLVGVALLLMAQLQRMSQLEELFAWLERDGIHLVHYDFARVLWARSRICKSAFVSLCVSGGTTALATVAAGLVMRIHTLGHVPTLILLGIAMVAIVYAMVMMVLDGRLEYGMFRARYEHLTGRDASQDSRWA